MLGAGAPVPAELGAGRPSGCSAGSADVGPLAGGAVVPAEAAGADDAAAAAGVAAGAAWLAGAVAAGAAAFAGAESAGGLKFAAADPAGARIGGAGAGNCSRSRRATGGSMVDDALLTNSPISLSLARTVLLSSPSSFASS